jgi:hypothetical protein
VLGRRNRSASDVSANAELAELKAEVQALHASQVALIREIRDEHVALVQDLHNRGTVQTDALSAKLDRVLQAAQAAADDEPRARKLVADLRTSPDYATAFELDDPLVSIIMPTYRNVAGLRDRSIPSALAQTHGNIEVIVVGDVAPAETAEVIASFSDPRLRYENLTVRGPYAEDKTDFWWTAGIYPLNRALSLVNGHWIAVLNDDDAFRPDFVERLLQHARATHAEVAYGKLRHHEPDKDDWDIGDFPPDSHKFAWQMAIHHSALRVFEYELYSPAFGEPGDWNRARRMLRAGVRFSMLDEVVADYWPSTLWKDRS